MRQMQVAILGQGRSGRDIHGFSLGHMEEQYKVVAVADLLLERRQRAQSEYGCTAYADYREIFQRKDIDLVINALPSHLHVPVSKEFLHHGFNVLCEKPLARFTKDVDDLVDAANRSGKILAVYQQSRFSPAFQQLQKVIKSGVLGRVVQVKIAYNGYARRWDWQTIKAMNGGNLLNTGPHPIDQALQLFGNDAVPQVICRMDSANSFGDAEDYVKILLYGDHRPTIDVEISSCEAYPESVYHVQGTHGGLTGNTSFLQWKYFTPVETLPQLLQTNPLEQPDGTPAYCSERLTWHDDQWNIDADQGSDLFLTMAKAYYDMLYDALLNRNTLQVTLQEIRQQISVMQTCFEQNPRFDLLGR